MIDRTLNYGRHHIKQFLSSAHPFDSVLDIGAGHGKDLSLAAEVDSRAQLIAVEVYPPYIEELRAKGIKVIPRDIERDPLPFSCGEVDVIIANQIMEHVKDVFWIFHQMSRVLPIGGKLIIGVPNLASLHNRILLAMGKQPSPIKTSSAHVRGFTKNDILDFLENCFPGGYRMSGFGGSNFYPFPPLIAKPLARMLPTMAWSIFMLLEKQRPYEREFLDFPVAQRLETNFYLGHTK